MINLIFQQNQRYRLAKHKKDIFKTNRRVTNYFSDIPDELDVTYHNDEPEGAGYVSDSIHNHLLHTVLPQLLKMKPGEIHQRPYSYYHATSTKLPNPYSTEDVLHNPHEINDARHFHTNTSKQHPAELYPGFWDRNSSREYTNPHLIKKLSPLEFHLTNGELKSPRDDTVLDHLSKHIVDKLNHPIIDYLEDAGKNGRKELANHVYQELINYMDPNITGPLHEFLDRHLAHKYTPVIKALGEKEPIYHDFNQALIKYLSPEE